MLTSPPATSADRNDTHKTVRAAARRQAQRDSRILEGLDELQRWIEDLLDAGLSQAPVREPGFWEARARRLIDAQAPGAARLLQDLPPLCSQPDWPLKLLQELAALHLLCESWRRLAQLPDALRASVELAVGLPQRVEDLANMPVIHDDWRVLTTVVEELERVRAQRTWLLGRQGQRALLLVFVPLRQPLSAWPAETLWRGGLRFFPGQVAQRAQFEVEPERLSERPSGGPAGGTIVTELAAVARRRAADPWCRLHPLLLRAGLRRRADSGEFVLVDAEQSQLELRQDYLLWSWFAQSLGASWDWLLELGTGPASLIRGWPA